MTSDPMPSAFPAIAAPAVAVQMTGIAKAFGPTLVLSDVDLQIRAGENGAGKSTLIKILAGDVRADGGSISRDGSVVDIRSVAQARAQGIAVVHQELSVIPNLTIAENLFLGRELTTGLRMDRVEMTAESRTLLSRLGLTLDPDTTVSQLDIAERQAVEICRALAEDARVLILDEPTAALTETERQGLFLVIEQLRQDGLAILYVSHHLTEIERLADRVTVLRNGSAVLCREKAGLTEAEIVQAMLGEPVEELFPTRSDPVPGDVVMRLTGVSYGRRVKGLDLELARGTIVGVTGLLGSGHREVGRLASGSVRPTSGTLQRLGSVVRFSPGDRKDEGLALGRSGTENLTVHDLNKASFNVGFRFLSRRRERALSATWGARLSVSGDLEAPVQSLSGGNQQKVLVGRNLDGEADLLVLEEPTRGVDIGARQDLYRLIRAETDRGAGALVVSTDLREVAGLCDRVIVMSRGNIVGAFDQPGISERQIYEACHSVVGDTTVVQTQRSVNSLRKFAFDRSAAPWIALLCIFIVASLASEAFLTVDNVQNLARQSVTTGLAGLAQLGVVLTGNIDLSIGAVAGLANLVSTDMLMSGIPAWLVLPITLAVGALVGIVNATLIRMGVPSLLATFAMASILRGIIIWRYPESIGPVPSAFQQVDSSSVLGVPLAFLTLIILFAGAEWLLRNTRFGLHLYAVGGDPRGARLSGVRPGRVVLAAFVCSGALAALAGFHLSARVGAGLPNSGTGLELEALAVVMIGGASIMGGSGTVRGLLAGVGIVVLLANVMNLTGLDAFLQNPIKGAVIILVAAVWGLRLSASRRRALLGVDGRY